MQRKTLNLLLSGTIVFLMVLAVASPASAISLEIELPDYASPGETVTGYVWIKDAGTVDKNFSSYQVYLTAPSALALTINVSAPYLNLGSTTQVESKFIASSHGIGSYLINPATQKVCEFDLTIPPEAAAGTSYAVNFSSSYGKPTYLMSYTTYYYNGESQGTTHGTIPGAVLVTVNDTISVADPGTYHNVTFYNGTSTVYKVTQVADGFAVARPADPVREGYTFHGWNYQNGTLYDFSSLVYTDLDLYADWTINSYNISYTQPSYGSVSGVSSAVYGSTVSITATPESGYRFSKLVVTKKGTGATVPVSGKTFTMPASDVTVSAQFTLIPTETPTPAPTQTSGGGGSTPSTPTGGQVTFDISAQYSGKSFVCIGTTPAAIAAIKAVDPVYGEKIEQKFALAQSAGVRLTNSNGAPVLTSSTLAPSNLERVSFAKVYDIRSADSSKELTQATVPVPKYDVVASGLTKADVTIYHYLSTYDFWVPLDILRITEDSSNYYYTVATDGAPLFGVLIKRFQTETVPTIVPVTPVHTQTPVSPVPFIGLIAGLGAVAVLFRMRK